MKKILLKLLSKHEDFKTEKASLFIMKKEAYIAASPDSMMTFKCHGRSAIEVKCPYSLKDKHLNSWTIRDCDILTVIDGHLKLKQTHKYYTQVISQMALTNSTQSYFVVWTTKGVIVERIMFDEKHWLNVLANLDIFYKTYVVPAILLIKPITFCGNCDKELLEETEIKSNEEEEHMRILCDECSRWYHALCENIDIKAVSKENWVCLNCLMSMGDVL